MMLQQFTRVGQIHQIALAQNLFLDSKIVSRQPSLSQ